MLRLVLRGDGMEGGSRRVRQLLGCGDHGKKRCCRTRTQDAGAQGGGIGLTNAAPFRGRTPYDRGAADGYRCDRAQILARDAFVDLQRVAERAQRYAQLFAAMCFAPAPEAKWGDGMECQHGECGYSLVAAITGKSGAAARALQDAGARVGAIGLTNAGPWENRL